jgi:hypothetical protein
LFALGKVVISMKSYENPADTVGFFLKVVVLHHISDIFAQFV